MFSSLEEAPATELSTPFATFILPSAHQILDQGVSGSWKMLMPGRRTPDDVSLLTVVNADLAAAGEIDDERYQRMLQGRRSHAMRVHWQLIEEIQKHMNIWSLITDPFPEDNRPLHTRRGSKALASLFADVHELFEAARH